ncbi:MAG: Eco57I restriction-modification methylase domain-containing protein [Lachnospiraceae bacterium]|nr:Eco57I restriction-modification methylase domain-containing protein [Lachnospiraceae bacterium]
MLDCVIESTNKYIDNMPKTERKKYGQFFTSKETARFMAGLYSVPVNKTKVSILDAGAGSGILSCAFLERLEHMDSVQEIELTCYENDSNILDLLKNNLKTFQKNSRKDIQIHIISDNYITSQYLDFNHMPKGNPSPQKYDFVIGNPPYMKIPKDAPEAVAMPEICYGAPNLYFIFAAMGLFNLNADGEMVYIIPRSWTSGAYFKRFRQYFLIEGKLEHIHLFVSRNKVFDKENVLQETIIIKVKKTDNTPDEITITSSVSNDDFDNLTSLTVPYSLVVSGNDYYVYLVTDENEISVLKRLHRFDKTLPEIGLRMKTGLTVDFRNREILRDKAEEGAIPLFYSQHIRQGEVQFPIQRKYEYVVTDQSGLTQDNRNYLFVKRFTAKEEHRRLQCGVYLSKNYPQYQKISTQNKINFVDGLLTEMSECLVYGLYVIFNSTLYDEYYRILNGSTQVNSTEINAMPIPDLEIIQEMGRKLMKSEDMSENNCNMILEGYCG